MKVRISWLALLLILTACSGITEQQAAANAEEFVRSNVIFYTNDEEGMTDVYDVSIQVTEIYRQDRDWIVQLYIESKVGEETKKSGLIVIVDGKTREIKKDKLVPFKV